MPIDNDDAAVGEMNAANKLPKIPKAPDRLKREREQGKASWRSHLANRAKSNVYKDLVGTTPSEGIADVPEGKVSEPVSQPRSASSGASDSSGPSSSGMGSAAQASSFQYTSPQAITGTDVVGALNKMNRSTVYALNSVGAAIASNGRLQQETNSNLMRVWGTLGVINQKLGRANNLLTSMSDNLDAAKYNRPSNAAPTQVVIPQQSAPQGQGDGNGSSVGGWWWNAAKTGAKYAGQGAAAAYGATRLRGGLGMLARGGAIYAADAIAGMAGVGSTPVDTEQDDKNWKRATVWEKMQSLPARGIEHVGDWIAPNVANQARTSRIESETEYLDKKNSAKADTQAKLEEKTAKIIDKPVKDSKGTINIEARELTIKSGSIRFDAGSITFSGTSGGGPGGAGAGSAGQTGQSPGQTSPGGGQALQPGQMPSQGLVPQQGVTPGAPIAVPQGPGGGAAIQQPQTPGGIGSMRRPGLAGPDESSSHRGDGSSLKSLPSDDQINWRRGTKGGSLENLRRSALVMDAAKSAGASREAAAALAGNAHIESQGFKSSAENNKGERSFGLFQMNGARQDGFKKWAAENKKDPYDHRNQVDYALNHEPPELSGVSKKEMEDFKSGPGSIEDKSRWWLQRWERARDRATGGQNDTERAKWSQRYALNYDNQEKTQDGKLAYGKGTDQDGKPKTGEPKVAGQQRPDVKDISDLSTYPRKGEKMDDPSAFVFHHTGGRGTPESVVETLNQRGLGVHYVMDRDGKIYKTLPDGSRGAHIMPGTHGLSNSNAQGMEVIAKDDKDLTPAQIEAGKAFGQNWLKQHPNAKIYGHGEANPGHKQATEGLTIAEAARNAPPQVVASDEKPKMPAFTKQNVRAMFGRGEFEDPKSTPKSSEAQIKLPTMLQKEFQEDQPKIESAVPQDAKADERSLPGFPSRDEQQPQLADERSMPSFPSRDDKPQLTEPEKSGNELAQASEQNAVEEAKPSVPHVTVQAPPSTQSTKPNDDQQPKVDEPRRQNVDDRYKFEEYYA